MSIIVRYMWLIGKIVHRCRRVEDPVGAAARVPALAVFVWAERYLVAGAAGAVKG